MDALFTNCLMKFSYFSARTCMICGGALICFGKYGSNKLVYVAVMKRVRPCSICVIVIIGSSKTLSQQACTMIHKTHTHKLIIIPRCENSYLNIEAGLIAFL